MVLIGLHTEEGALGLVLNRPSTSSVASAVPQLEELIDTGEPVFVGGPVQSSAVVMLAEFEDPCGGRAAGARAGSGCRRPRRASSSSPPRRRRRRVYAGYAGWSEGQLDAEIEAGDWIPQDALPDDVFSVAPRAALEQRPGAQGRAVRPARPDAARTRV